MLLLVTADLLKVARWFMNLTHLHRKRQKKTEFERKRLLLCRSTLESKLMNLAKMKTVLHIKKKKKKHCKEGTFLSVMVIRI